MTLGTYWKCEKCGNGNSSDKTTCGWCDTGLFRCSICGGDQGEFNTETGNHVFCEKLESILQEMERYYSESFFPGTSKEVDDEVEKVFPNFVGRNSASMGRHLAQLIRRKMKETDE